MSDSIPRAWVDGPFELLSSELSGTSKNKQAKGTQQVAAEMTIVHNCVIRGINAIYLQAAKVAAAGTPEDKLDFVNFALRWARMLDEHHRSEEEEIFPQVNKLAGVSGLMDANVDEHTMFHDGLSDFMTYLGSIIREEDVLDAEKLNGLIDSFMPALREHLRNEVLTLKALDKYEDTTDWMAWFKKTADGLVMRQMKSPVFRVESFPLVFVLHDKSFEGGVWENFPPVPWVMRIIFRWMFFSKHQRWWRFAGCNFDSLPQELLFA